MAGLEQRLETLRQSRERERAEAERELERHAAEAERTLRKAHGRLEAREKHLENARAGIESRDRRLKTASEELEARGEELKARDQELTKIGAALEAQRTEVAVTRARLELREEELERSRATAQEARRELDAMRERLTMRERELDAAGTLLEAQGAELADARRSRAASQRELDEAKSRLEAREGHLRTAQLGIESRDRKLKAAERALGSRDADLSSRDAELERLRATARVHERELALAEARLAKAQQRAEHFQGSLVELREGRAYRLMRILWRLRRPFRRAPREAVAPDGAEDDSEGSPAPPIATVAELRELEPPRPAPSAPDLAPSSQIDQQRRQPGDRLRVASILDEMSEACFAPECDLIPLTLERWAEQLDERHPDLLLVESAWNGNGGEWQYRIAQYRRKDLAGLPALRALLDGCRERGIPTAFWNKEDPVHFDRFAEAAALFDHVFTTDARCVERYRALPGGERTVAPLPFAAQPRIHNPAAAVSERSTSPCFAGAWYRDRHPDRRRALAALLDAARPRGLVIYDRSFGGEDGAFGFPERFAPHVLGGLPYERILDVYKSHHVFLNANSVADSPTMCSRRVFELAACDTAILSTPGAALTALLGEGMVEEADDEETAATALERLLGDGAERRRRTRAARRAVFAAHTYAERLATIAETAGLDASSLRRRPFAALGEPANGAGTSSNGAGDRHPWLLALQPGVALAEPALADLAAAASFAAADVIGAHPAGNGNPAMEHRHVPDLDPAVLLLRRELVEARGPVSGSPEQVHTQLRQWSEEGIRLYAADADLLPRGLAQHLARPA